MAEQKVCQASLGELPERVRAEALEAPVLVIIGRVVEAMAWLEDDRVGDDLSRQRGHG
jgi:siroheme synthase